MKIQLLILILLQVVNIVIGAENSETVPESMAESLSDADEESEDSAPTNTLRFARKDPSKEDNEDQEDDTKSGNTGSSQQPPQGAEEAAATDANKTLKPPKLNMSAALFTKVPEKREINPKDFPTTITVQQTSSSSRIKFCISLSLLIALAF